MCPDVIQYLHENLYRRTYNVLFLNFEMNEIDIEVTDIFIDIGINYIVSFQWNSARFFVCKQNEQIVLCGKFERGFFGKILTGSKKCSPATPTKTAQL